MDSAPLNYEPIDVVIPCTEKDLATLELCIQGIRQNIEVRRIIVISDNPLTNSAEWFDEKNYPFNKLDIYRELPIVSKKIKFPPRLGWIYQQFLKLYAPFVIPEISSNILIVDADTIFLNPVTFFDDEGNALYNPAKEYHKPYFEHMERLLPGFSRVNHQYSGIAHHMLFQRYVIEELFNKIEIFHGTKAWKAMCRCVDKTHLNHASLSEYEIYFNFVLGENYPIRIRPFKWKNTPLHIKDLSLYKKEGYHYVTCHSHAKLKKRNQQNPSLID